MKKDPEYTIPPKETEGHRKLRRMMEAVYDPCRRERHIDPKTGNIIEWRK